MRRLTPTQQGHLVVLTMSILVVVASMILTPSDSVVSLFGVPLPPLCTFKRLTGMDCPGCGLTRSFTYMGHGEVLLAFSKHKLGPLLYSGVAAMIPWHGYKLARSFLRPAPALPLGAPLIRD